MRTAGTSPSVTGRPSGNRLVPGREMTPTSMFPPLAAESRRARADKFGLPVSAQRLPSAPMASTSLPCRYLSSMSSTTSNGTPSSAMTPRTASGWITVRPPDCTASVTLSGRRRSMSCRTAAAFSSWNGA